jgi:transposase-like protein
LKSPGRERIVRQVMSRQTPKAAALAVGVCPRTIRKWVGRYGAEGLPGIRDRSSQPRRPAPQEVVLKIEQLRRQRWTVKVERVMTDNGSCYLCRTFGQTCKKLDLKMAGRTSLVALMPAPDR